MANSHNFRQRPDWMVIYFIGALLIVILFASIYGFTHNVGEGTKTGPTSKPSVPATVSSTATLSPTPSVAVATAHTGAEARNLVIEYYDGYTAQITAFSSDAAARHAYLAKYMDSATIASIDAENWAGHVPCCGGIMSEEVFYQPAAISGAKATIDIVYDIHHATTPEVVVDLNSLKIVSVKCVPALKY